MEILINIKNRQTGVHSYMLILLQAYIHCCKTRHSAAKKLKTKSKSDINPNSN